MCICHGLGSFIAVRIHIMQRSPCRAVIIFRKKNCRDVLTMWGIFFFVILFFVANKNFNNKLQTTFLRSQKARKVLKCANKLSVDRFRWILCNYWYPLKTNCFLWNFSLCFLNSWAVFLWNSKPHTLNLIWGNWHLSNYLFLNIQIVVPRKRHSINSFQWRTNFFGALKESN